MARRGEISRGTHSSNSATNQLILHTSLGNLHGIIASLLQSEIAFLIDTKPKA